MDVNSTEQKGENVHRHRYWIDHEYHMEARLGSCELQSRISSINVVNELFGQ